MPVWLSALLLGLFIGSLVEYWGHRLMHGWLWRKLHAEHHRDGWGQGWFGEFRDYFVGSLPFMFLGFLYGFVDPAAVWESGLGFAAGGALYAAFSSYSHQLQHEKPELCFWMVRPVHFLHHREKMWHANFGIGLDVWDRVFGTYRKAEWTAPPRGSWLGLFRIHWFSPSADTLPWKHEPETADTSGAAT